MEDDQYGAPDQAAEKGFAAELEDVLFVFPLNFKKNNFIYNDKISKLWFDHENGF